VLPCGRDPSIVTANKRPGSALPRWGAARARSAGSVVLAVACVAAACGERAQDPIVRPA
jgi:hypothetical protein